MNRNKKYFYESEPSAHIFQDIFFWFRDKLTIIFPNDIVTDYSSAFQTDRINDVTNLLNAFGTEILYCKLVDVEFEKFLQKVSDVWRNVLSKTIENKQVRLNRGDLQNAKVVCRYKDGLYIVTLTKNQSVTCQKVQFIHNRTEISFSLSEESDGTIRLLDLLEILLNDQQKVYVIDELDRCLHPMLSRKFVQIYLELAKERNNQFIVTTHESRLIDLKLLRRDEIWFVEKNSEGQAKIYSLEEYNTRFDQKAEKAYLEGRYGGVPIFGKKFPIKTSYKKSS